MELFDSSVLYDALQHFGDNYICYGLGMCGTIGLILFIITTFGLQRKNGSYQNSGKREKWKPNWRRKLKMPKKKNEIPVICDKKEKLTEEPMIKLSPVKKKMVRKMKVENPPKTVSIEKESGSAGNWVVVTRKKTAKVPVSSPTISPEKKTKKRVSQPAMAETLLLDSMATRDVALDQVSMENCEAVADNPGTLDEMLMAKNDIEIPLNVSGDTVAVAVNDEEAGGIEVPVDGIVDEEIALPVKEKLLSEEENKEIMKEESELVVAEVNDVKEDGVIMPEMLPSEGTDHAMEVVEVVAETQNGGKKKRKKNNKKKAVTEEGIEGSPEQGPLSVNATVELSGHPDFPTGEDKIEKSKNGVEVPDKVDMETTTINRAGVHDEVTICNVTTNGQTKEEVTVEVVSLPKKKKKKKNKKGVTKNGDYEENIQKPKNAVEVPIEDDMKTTTVNGDGLVGVPTNTQTKEEVVSKVTRDIVSTEKTKNKKGSIQNGAEMTSVPQMLSTSNAAPTDDQPLLQSGSNGVAPSNGNWQVPVATKRRRRVRKD